MKKKYIFISALSVLCIILTVYVCVKIFSLQSDPLERYTFENPNYDAVVDELLAIGNDISGEKINEFINEISNLNMKDSFPVPICIKVRSDLSGDILLTNDNGTLKDSDFVNKFISFNKNYKVKAFDNFPNEYMKDGVTDELLIWRTEFENMSGE